MNVNNEMLSFFSAYFVSSSDLLVKFREIIKEKMDEKKNTDERTK